MLKVKSFQLMFFAMIVLFFLFPFIGQTSTKTGIKASEDDKRLDRITLQLEAGLTRNEMPGVSFKHDFHTQALEDKCDACHIQKDKAFIFKFKRTDEKASMELYHDECIACHIEKKAAEEPSGPDAAECRTCHVAEQPGATSWKEIKFDKSLHFVHESSSQIKSMDSSDTNNCSACHHQYNEKTKEIFYVKGDEGSCFYCHKSTPKDDIRSIREASHDACVKCHQSLKSQKIDSGPVTCEGCHDGEKQRLMKKLTDVPRLKRNQPDVVAITGWEPDSRTKNTYMKAVPFDHKFHEAKAETCKSCHHETLKKCSDCHTTAGGEAKGGFVSLGQAMHSPDSSQSCVGCHRDFAKSPDCAGCHFSMPAKNEDSESCQTCHSLAPSQLESMEPAALAHTAMADRRAGYEPVPVDKIPETVVIDVLSKEYQPSSFPHRKVVQAIIERVEKSDMARTFHTDQAGLCMGCHHNSPKSLEPPKCASCHSKNGPAPGEGSDGRPGLKGAYHGQCITCHQKMDVTAVAATDCAKCHEQKK
jgi:hypothetical protein